MENIHLHSSHLIDLIALAFGCKIQLSLQSTLVLSQMDFEACVRQRVPPRYVLSPENLEDAHDVLLEILPHNPHYVKKVLGQLILSAEKDGEVPEVLYETYCSPEILQATELKPTDTDIVEYRVAETKISIPETPRLISGMGTTGLRTWEAALFLSEHLAQMDLRSKIVLELGCGTGLVGMSLLKSGNCSKVILTDGDEGVVDKLESILHYNGTHAQSKQLRWGEDPILPGEVLVAADVTYDTSILQDLRVTIQNAFLAGYKQVLIAATVRNPDTIELWEQELSTHFTWDITASRTRQDLHTHCWYPPETPEIKIYSILARE